MGAARSRQSATPYSRATKFRCCSTVRWSNSRGSSGKKASRRLAATGSDLRSTPPMRTAPKVAGMMPVAQRRVVVLPAPLGPTRPMTSPGRTVKERSCTAVNSP